MAAGQGRRGGDRALSYYSFILLYHPTPSSPRKRKPLAYSRTPPPSAAAGPPRCGLRVPLELTVDSAGGIHSDSFFLGILRSSATFCAYFGVTWNRVS